VRNGAGSVRKRANAVRAKPVTGVRIASGKKKKKNATNTKPNAR
jgi:hypothetical protein